jgi:hypothetical protein
MSVWVDESDLPDWDPDADVDYDPYEDPYYDEDKDPWVWRPVVTVELPPFDEGSGVPVLRDGGAA